MKKNIWFIPVSFIVSVLILFGSWHLYHSYALENPLLEHVQQIEGVKDAMINIADQGVTIQLELAPDAQMSSVYNEVQQSAASILKDRNVKIELMNQSSERLNEWWSHMLFDIAEAMETKQYGKIPKLLEESKGKLPDMQVHYDLDDQNVYVRLVHGDDAKFIVLPRTPAQYVGWSHE